MHLAGKDLRAGMFKELKKIYVHNAWTQVEPQWQIETTKVNQDRNPTVEKKNDYNEKIITVWA